MNFYERRILPHIINLGMRMPEIAARRATLIPGASGRVLEIGVGSGLNLPFYSAAAREIIGIEPSPRLLAMAQAAARRAPTSVPIDFRLGVSEALPLDSASVDTVVTTWTLCTIPEVQKALAEMRRVLKSTGSLLFVEHGQAPDADVRRWQDRINPVWKCLCGGCHLNRPIAALITGAGFQMEHLDAGYMPKGPRFAGYMYQGRARP